MVMGHELTHAFDDQGESGPVVPVNCSGPAGGGDAFTHSDRGCKCENS